MKDSVIAIHTEDRIRTGLVVSDGPKYYGVIWPDSSGIRINKLGKRTARFTVIAYSLNKAKKTLRRCGKNFGITKGAKIALRG
jgi:hypothetical protein